VRVRRGSFALRLGLLAGSVLLCSSGASAVAGSPSGLSPPSPYLQARAAESGRALQSLRLAAASQAPASSDVVLRQADTTYTDTVGDAQGGADISRVVWANDANGNVAVGVFYANRTCATTSDLVLIGLDVDQNPATGYPPLGYEYLLYADGFTGTRGVQRFGGTTFAPVGLPSFQAYCDSRGFEFWYVNRADIGVGAGLNFLAATYTDPAATQVSDVVPSSLPPLLNYQLALTPSPTPPPSPPPSPTPPPPPVPRPKSYADAPSLPARIAFTGASIKHVRLGENLYDTMKKLGLPRVVQVACWSVSDWPTVLTSAGIDARPALMTGFWLPRQPRWVHVGPRQCADVQALLTTRASTGQRAYALATVLHERVHAEGFRNEAQTNCLAVQLVYEFARELNFVFLKAIRLEQLAVRKTRAVAPRGYWNDRRCRDGGAWDLYPSVRNLKY
jgi:hypothetical protein